MMLNICPIIQRKAEAPIPSPDTLVEMRKHGRNWQFVLIQGEQETLIAERFIKRTDAITIASEFCKVFNGTLRINDCKNPRKCQKRKGTLVRR